MMTRFKVCVHDRNYIAAPCWPELERLAARRFCTCEGHIIVPGLHVTSMIVATCDRIGSRARPCPRTSPGPSSSRPLARRKGGGGRHLGEVRGSLVGHRDQAVEPAGAVLGRLHRRRRRHDQRRPPEILWKALDRAGTYVGIGSARKMGWGGSP